ncbi:siderophore ABC transporter substrate-binding protein [Bacillus swezeyi]|uniref:ABC transporter n=1 Tax=Bacillus swezeyi TaxID=1925020 RepID=A0A5M8RMA3_9BACI|nr:siderophore ABC transporter substrate-binding protein [Bacillus swezeyi]KAA6449737.1 ABC transporter [Bacillus swezeyi]KAA6474484.1 ABC transporter [Bacillus swezeyi]TYS33582.1 siderophore ABC transporter substrate-binding protein [Bacillus swezeyi]
MKKLSLFFMALITVLVIAACGSKSADSDAKSDSKKEETVSIKHSSDTTEVPKNPKKVVVFNFGMLDTLDELGLSDRVVGLPKQNLPSYLKQYKDSKYESVGGLKEPDFEKIAELEPDLIIIEGRQSEQYDEFKKIAPTINIQLDQKNYMESFKENTESIGKIFGKEDAVKDTLAKIDDQVEKVNKLAKEKGGKGLVVLTSDKQISAYGSGSRFGLVHDVLGVAPADQNIEASLHGQSVSSEYISEKNPDYLFVIDRSAAIGEKGSAKEVIENDIVKSTNAYKNGHITYLDPGYWYLSGGGLESVSEMAKEIENGLK